jgi:hypothetical protein
MKRLITLLLLIICNEFIFSQLRQILVLNEGAFDYINNQVLTPVTIGSFDPGTGLYSNKNEIIGSRFASDIVIDEDSYWVAADMNLVQYKLNTHEKLSEHIVEGIRKIAFYKDLIIITRGEYLKIFPSYVQVYNKNTFSLLFEIPFSELPFSTESIIVKNDIAYVAVNNGFDFGKEVGKVVKIDLVNLSVLETIDLGSDGKNPENLMIKNDLLISLNNKDFTGSSVSLINSGTSDVSTYNLSNVNSLCGTSTLVGDLVVYQDIGKTDLGSFEILSKQSGFLRNLNKSYYGMTYDPKSKYLCAAETDFRSTGKVYIYDTNFNEQFVFDAGITPGYFAFDDATSVSANNIKPLTFEFSPNPVHTKIKVFANQEIEGLKILDLYGRELLRSNNEKIELKDLQPGAYVLIVLAKDKLAYKTFIKADN